MSVVRAENARRPLPIDAAVVFASALAFYWITLAPTVIWGDSADFALAVRDGRFPLGTAGDHPLFLIVGQLFARLPGDLARNINFEAGCFGALTVMLVYSSARELGASRAAALAGAAALCVSHAFWLHSVIAEVYTANAFFLIATIYLLLVWRRTRRGTWLAAAFATFAVGLTNHLVLATMAPAIAVFVAATIGRSLFTRGALIALAGVAALVISVLVVQPAVVMTRLFHLWYGPPGIRDYLQLDVDVRATLTEAKFYGLYLAYQFPSVALILGGAGIWIVLRREPRVALLLLLTLVANAFTFVRHTVWPSAQNAKFVFYITDYVVFSVLVAVGTDALLQRRALRWSALAIIACIALMPPLIYGAAPWAVRKAGINLLHARALPNRDNERFFLNPNKRGEFGARRFGEDVLRSAQPGAVIFTDYTPYTVLRYLKVVDHMRPDVLLLGPKSTGDSVNPHWIDDASGRRRPTYLAAYTAGYHDLSGLKGEFELVPFGPLLEVHPR